MAKLLTSSTVPVIRSPADGGAIIVNSITSSSPNKHVFTLALKPETCLEGDGTFKQWFYFEVQNVTVGSELEFMIVDAGDSTFNDWTNYKTCMSTDRVTWSRIKETNFEDGGEGGNE
jgi:hypothetical protein